MSDWTLAFDRLDKARLYARAGIAEYWIVNVRNRQVEVHRLPTDDGSGYADVRPFSEGESVRPLAAPAGAPPLLVGDLLPLAEEEPED